MPPSTLKSPFPPSSEVVSAGRGEVVLAVLAPNNPTITKESYQYPLKLVSRTPAFTPDSKYPSSATTPVHLYLLTYGGGLLPCDHIDLSITLRPRSRLVVTTPQGSTKIYKTDAKHSHPSGKSGQYLNVELGSQAGLCYLPEPTVPFESSRYEQVQRFTVLRGDQASEGTGGEDNPDVLPPSLCVLDWVTQGRVTRGENWSFHEWTGRNEVWVQDCKTKKKKLLLRDTVTLSDDHLTTEGVQSETDKIPTSLPIADRVHPHGIVGTLILHGPLFESLASFIMQEFISQPRIGGRDWSLSASAAQLSESKKSKGDVVWTAARVRHSFVLVKFGAPTFEAAREWLSEIVRREGSVENEFGDEALGCL